MKMNCKHCGTELDFDQPYPIHAGFSGEGFLYNDAGDTTLIWSSYDPAYTSVIPDKHPWDLTEEERNKFESLLHPAPSGGKWRFQNPLRCMHCHEAISAPITETIYYYRYPNKAVSTDEAVGVSLSLVIKRPA